jgi:hypothetical protein
VVLSGYSTTKTGHNDIAEILLKVAESGVKHQKSSSSNLRFTASGYLFGLQTLGNQQCPFNQKSW